MKEGVVVVGGGGHGNSDDYGNGDSDGHGHYDGGGGCDDASIAAVRCGDDDAAAKDSNDDHKYNY